LIFIRYEPLIKYSSPSGNLLDNLKSFKSISISFELDISNVIKESDESIKVVSFGNILFKKK